PTSTISPSSGSTLVAAALGSAFPLRTVIFAPSPATASTGRRTTTSFFLPPFFPSAAAASLAMCALLSVRVGGPRGDGPGGGGFGRRLVDHNDDLDTPVGGATLGVGVAAHRPVLSVTGGRQASWSGSEGLLEQPDDGDGTIGRQVPVVVAGPP